MKTIAIPGAAGNSAIRFPHRRIAAVFVFCEEDGPWLVLGPRGHGWAHSDRHVAQCRRRMARTQFRTSDPIC
jgi:hypothetical protein